LALKATRQSVIIAKLSSYPRKNRTKKALWELDNLRALNRGEFYHKLVRAVAYIERSAAKPQPQGTPFAEGSEEENGTK
jgi:hypothetical protein